MAKGAPSRRKSSKNKIIAGVIVGVAAIAILVGVAIANQFFSLQESPTDADAVSDTADSPVGSSTAGDKIVFVANTSTESSTSFDLIDESGSVVSLSNSNASLIGLYSGGMALTSWRTKDHDDEWNRDINIQDHMALVDSAGNTVVDLDPMLQEYGLTTDSKIYFSSSNSYSSGRLILPVTSSSTGCSYPVLDEKGELVFSLNDATHSYGIPQNGGIFQDGVLEVFGGSDNYGNLIDVDGNVLVSGTSIQATPSSLGYGYYMKSSENNDGAVYNYSGEALFLVSSVNQGDISGAELCYECPGEAGIAGITAYKKNPYGGDDKKLKGLYNVASGKWIVSLDEGLITFTKAREGVLWVHKEKSRAGSNGSSPTYQSSLIDTEGNVIFDSSMASDGINIPDNFMARYLHDGWWGLYEYSGSNEPIGIIHIENGQCSSVQSISFKPASFPQSEPMNP